MEKHYSDVQKNIKAYIYWRHGFLVGLFKSLNTTVHRHYSVEINIGLDSPLKIDMGNGWCEYQAVIIDSNHPHKFNGGNNWNAVFLMDPNIVAISKLRQKLFDKGEKYLKIDNDIISPFIKKLKEFKDFSYTCHDIALFFNELIHSIVNGKRLYVDNNPKRNIHPRIQNALRVFEDIPEKKISIRELSRLVNLSESRLAHLFKDQLGIPIRRFLLWLRLKEAMKLIFDGESFTNAAHESGFSDLAHLSRTFKHMFGISLSRLFKFRQFIKLVTSF